MLLEPSLQCKNRKDLFFAGQITGTEGYSESIATGMLAGINMAKMLKEEELLVLPDITMLGALMKYITTAEQKHFQPINSNWGIVAQLDVDKKIKKNKKIKNELLSKRSLEYMESIIRPAV